MNPKKAKNLLIILFLLILVVLVIAMFVNSNVLIYIGVALTVLFVFA